MGLVNSVHADHEALWAEADRLSRAIAENPPLVVQGCKAIFNDQTEREAQRGLDFVAAWNSAFLQSDDLMEAFAAFAEKRPPRFQGS